jgi:hypothetical protein
VKRSAILAAVIGLVLLLASCILFFRYVWVWSVTPAYLTARGPQIREGRWPDKACVEVSGVYGDTRIFKYPNGQLLFWEVSSREGTEFVYLQSTRTPRPEMRGRVSGALPGPLFIRGNEDQCVPCIDADAGRSGWMKVVLLMSATGICLVGLVLWTSYLRMRGSYGAEAYRARGRTEGTRTRTATKFT